MSMNDALKIDAAGHVGIGTPTPDPNALLDVNGRAKASSLVVTDKAEKGKYALDVPNGNVRIGGFLIGPQDSLVGSSENGFLRHNNGDVVLNANKGHNLYLGFDQGNEIYFGLGNKMVLTQSGSLGIGKLDPESSSLLDVNGNAIFRGNIGIGKGKAPDSSYRLDVNGKAVIHGGGVEAAAGTTVALQVNGGFAKFQYNTQGLPATEKGGGLVIGYNLSNGNAETNFYNVFPGAGSAFHFEQMTKDGKAKKVLSIEGNGDLYVPGTLWLHDDGSVSGHAKAFRNVIMTPDGHMKVWPTPQDDSDLRLKHELQPIPSALDKVQQLRGLTFRWNDDGLRHLTRDVETTVSAGPGATAEENETLWQAERARRCETLAGTQVGVVAQEVEAVLPEAVATDEAGYKSVRYRDLIPLLIEAAKELAQTVEDQSRLAAQQQQEIARLTAEHRTLREQAAELAAVKAQVAALAAAVQRVAATQGSGDPDAMRVLAHV